MCWCVCPRLYTVRYGTHMRCTRRRSGTPQGQAGCDTWPIACGIRYSAVQVVAPEVLPTRGRHTGLSTPTTPACRARPTPQQRGHASSPLWKQAETEECTVAAAHPIAATRHQTGTAAQHQHASSSGWALRNARPSPRAPLAPSPRRGLRGRGRCRQHSPRQCLALKAEVWESSSMAGSPLVRRLLEEWRRAG